MGKKRGAVSLAVLIVLVFLSLQFVSAVGKNFDTAELITAGTYNGGPLAPGESDYYKIQITSGQHLVVAGNFEGKTGYIYNEIDIYDANRKKLNYNVGSGYTLSTSYITSSGDEGIFYIRILASYYTTASYFLNISLKDKTDLDSGRDAGSSFDTALEISPGNYPDCCWLNYDTYGKDEKDFYKIDLKKGDKLTAKLTPGTYNANTIGTFGITIYDSSRTLKDEEDGQNAGQIVTVEYVAVKDETAYIIASVSWYSYGGTYSLDITVEGGHKPKICTAGKTRCSSDDKYVEKCSTDGSEWKKDKTCKDASCYESGGSAYCETESTTKETESTTGGTGGKMFSNIFTGLSIVSLIFKIAVQIIALFCISLILFLLAKIKFFNVQAGSFGRSFVVALIFILITFGLDFFNVLASGFIYLIGFVLLYLLIKLIMRAGWGWALLLAFVSFIFYVGLTYFTSSLAAGFLGFLALLILVPIFLGFVMLIWEIYILIEILAKSDNDTNWKLTWTLVTLILGIIGIIIYYAVGRKNRIPKSS